MSSVPDAQPHPGLRASRRLGRAVALAAPYGAGASSLNLALHPFQTDVRRVEAPEGASLAEMAALHVADPVLRAHLIAFVDGQPVAAELWGETRPVAGSHVVLRVVP
ncbi:MAG: hypothetical protein ACQRW7_02355, partial [Caulobacterales bacterium]|uniref:hypothetical protein n=1 Tax=Glycocaulis sp. TaxID=1969725 RepID=UPI003FA127A1